MFKTKGNMRHTHAFVNVTWNSNIKHKYQIVKIDLALKHQAEKVIIWSNILFNSRRLSIVNLQHLRAATDESQKTRNKKQETKRFSTFAVYRLRHSETKKNIA